jgi:hypothetical protein
MSGDKIREKPRANAADKSREKQIFAKFHRALTLSPANGSLQKYFTVTVSSCH